MKRYSLGRVAAIALGALFLSAVCVRLAGTKIRQALTRLQPGVTLVLAIDSAHPYRAGLSPADARAGTLEELEARLAPLTGDALFRADGDRVQVILPRGVDAERAARQLTRSGQLAFKLVDDSGSVVMHNLSPCAIIEGAALDRDGWSEREGGATHSDFFVRAPERSTIERVLHKCAPPLPADRSVAFGRLDRDGARGWRSYYLFARVELDGGDITDAEVTWDAATDRPEVDLTLSNDGLGRFAALTSRAVGRKLAIMLEDVVTSAPVIEGPISGKHVRVTMGGLGIPTP